jgi:hypothetical protein
MFCWTPVTLDCTGAVEPPGIHYRHEVALIPPQGFVPCDEGMCAEPRQDPVWVNTQFTTECTPVPEPGPGELMLLKTTAIDAAGNEDCGI